MKRIRKVLSVVAVLAIMLMVHFGIPTQASAVPLPPSGLTIIDIDPSLFDSTVQYTLIDPVVMNTTSILEAQQLTFQDSFTAAGSLNLISAIGGVTFLSDLTLDDGPLLVNGSVGFGGGENALGFVAPVPHPRGDDAFSDNLGDQLAAIGVGVTSGASLVSLGYVAPVPHPPKDEMYGWASNAMIVNGTLDLTNVMLNVDSIVPGSEWHVGDFLTLFGATGGINGIPTLSGAQASNWAYFDPKDEFGNETAGIMYVGVPEPSTILLLGAGLLGLAGFGVVRRRKTAAK